MIEKMAERIALTMKRINPDETASVEVMKFSLSLLINLMAITTLSLAIGALTGKFSETLLVLVSIAILRQVSGGIHLKTSEACVIFSTLAVVAIPHLPINEKWCIILTIVSAVLVLIFAPSRIEEQTRIPRKYWPLLKIIAFLIVSSNFLLQSGILACAFFLQSVGLIRKIKLRK